MTPMHPLAAPLERCRAFARASLLYLAACAAASAWADTPGDLAGTYYLRGVTEVGSVLRLRPSGRFEYSISYGAVDQSATGTWQADGGRVTLTADTPPAPRLAFGERRGEPLPRYAEAGAPPVLLTVQVASPSLGLVWSRVEITAEFSNGRTRSGVTGRSGELGFKALDDAQWKGAVVQRVSAAYPPGKVPPVWVNVDARHDKTIVFHFEPGSLMQPAFATMQLTPVRAGRSVQSLKVVPEAGATESAEYVRE